MSVNLCPYQVQVHTRALIIHACIYIYIHCKPSWPSFTIYTPTNRRSGAVTVTPTFHPENVDGGFNGRNMCRKTMDGYYQRLLFPAIFLRPHSRIVGIQKTGSYSMISMLPPHISNMFEVKLSSGGTFQAVDSCKVPRSLIPYQKYAYLSG